MNDSTALVYLRGADVGPHHVIKPTLMRHLGRAANSFSCLPCVPALYISLHVVVIHTKQRGVCVERRGGMTLPPSVSCTLVSSVPTRAWSWLSRQSSLSEKGVRLAQRMQVGTCVPVGMQLQKAEVGQTSGPTWSLSHLAKMAAEVMFMRPMYGCCCH